MKCRYWYQGLLYGMAGAVGLLLLTAGLLLRAETTAAQSADQPAAEPQQVTPAPDRETVQPDATETSIPDRPTLEPTSTTAPPILPTSTTAPPILPTSTTAPPILPTSTTAPPILPTDTPQLEPTLASDETPLPARPTVEPLPDSTATTAAPTSTPAPPPPRDDGDDDDDDDDGDDEFSNETGDEATGDGTGRITGTVIDQTTGFPMPGIAVKVGDIIVYTDANGNYDVRNLTPGTYPVELLLEPWQGKPSQETKLVTIEAAETVVQHLSYTSTVEMAAFATPPTVDLIATLMPAGVGGGGVNPVIIPRDLPDTAGPPAAPAAPAVPLWALTALLLAAAVATTGYLFTRRAR